MIQPLPALLRAFLPKLARAASGWRMTTKPSASRSQSSMNWHRPTSQAWQLQCSATACSLDAHFHSIFRLCDMFLSSSACRSACIVRNEREWEKPGDRVEFAPHMRVPRGTDPGGQSFHQPDQVSSTLPSLSLLLGASARGPWPGFVSLSTKQHTRTCCGNAELNTQVSSRRFSWRPSPKIFL